MSNFDHRNVYRVASASQISEQLDRCMRYALSGENLEDVVSDDDGSFMDPPGGKRVPRGRLKEIREEVLEWEKSLALRTETVDVELRDRELASLLYEQLSVLPAQAGDTNFWSTLSTFVFPDVISRRFALKSPKNIRERFVDPRRGGIKRLWLRRRAISEDLESEFSHLLNQDYVQQIVERPSIASDSRMVRECLRVSDDARKEGPRSRDFDRNVVKEATLFYGVSIPQLLRPTDIYDRLWECSIRFSEPDQEIN